MQLTFNITFGPGTSVEDAAMIREKMLKSLLQHTRWFGQERASIDSILIDDDTKEESAHD